MSITIAVDAMGGDHGISVTLPATLSFLEQQSDAQAILVGDSAIIEQKLSRQAIRERIRVCHASQVVEMHEPPAAALRSKKDSSMRVAIDLVKSGEAQACVSAGNTGALMAISRFVLKTISGIDRPAIASQLPTMRGETTVLDLGANVNCGAEHLLQFAIMGSALAAGIEQVDKPSIGLLNIGEEDIKGNDVVKQAAELLRASSLNFYGNVEGNDIYQGTTDVVVCDGFVGNVALKTSEGLAQMLGTFLRQEFKRNALTMASGLIAWPVLNAFRRRIDHRRYNGASLLGLKGIVMKSHGSADKLAFRCALNKAYAEVSNKVLERISERLISEHADLAASEADNHV